MCLCLFILKGGRVFLEHLHQLDANGAAQARALVTPTFVAGGCQVCNTGVLRLGDDVRESLEKLGLEGGDVLKAALMAAEMLCAAAKVEYTTWEAAFEGV
jgi:hypothetical protein